MGTLGGMSAVIAGGPAAGALMPPLGCVLCHAWAWADSWDRSVVPSCRPTPCLNDSFFVPKEPSCNRPRYCTCSLFFFCQARFEESYVDGNFIAEAAASSVEGH